MSNELAAAPALCTLFDRYTYHVIVSAAQMPNKCWGIYKRVGVVEVDHHERPLGYVPSRIADIRGVRVVETWERCNAGTTKRCAAAQAEAEAHALAERLRAQRIREAANDAGSTARDREGN